VSKLQAACGAGGVGEGVRTLVAKVLSVWGVAGADAV